MLLVKINIYIVTAAVFRVIHFTHPPVSPLASNSKIEFSFPDNGLSVIDMTDTGNNLACKFQMQRINDCNVTIQLQVIIGSCRFLTSRARQSSIRNPVEYYATELLPRNPLKRAHVGSFYLLNKSLSLLISHHILSVTVFIQISKLNSEVLFPYCFMSYHLDR